MGINNSKIDAYINEICSHVRYKQAHNEIKAELLDHFEEKLEEQRKEGIEESELVERVLLEMGDAEFIGRQLNESHKAAPERGIILLTVALSFIGMFSIYFIVANGISPNMTIFYKNTVFNILGYCIISALYFFDYRILEKYSKKIYIVVTAILVLQMFMGDYVNGRKNWIHIGVIGIDIIEVSLFFYAVALSKILKELDWNNTKQVIQGFAMAFVPLVLYSALRVRIAEVIYMMLFLTLMIATKSKLRYIISAIGILITGGIYYLVSEPYRTQAIFSFLHPEQDPLGAGYVNFQIAKLLKSVTWFGHGFTFPQKTIPEVQNDFILTYIIYTFGWIAGIIVIMLAFIFIVRMFIAAKKVKDKFGSLIIQGFMCIFALEFVWNILMILGLAPIISVSLPFISYGGTRAITQMAAIGLILSIYRRKNLSNITTVSIKSENTV
ncbi:FtsW/RodA/SpoVE family cell cycle protein [Clostridium sp. OS1-26]|uniref:FtsW/RodA/SpoVE family cell cycle protein n=1 Tax=Clostridium sp. OS1-26 TaxID=3070681 RepID=UPI0027DEF6C7|nr:FtsW/RodA/SpoVE family cell cycle protein [Clostridium sp. OS1-26]WML33159.1 FtsW/RodA/SpoVE family cell cycle protein [Clostridium sp. OS1-26]